LAPVVVAKVRPPRRIRPAGGPMMKATDVTSDVTLLKLALIVTVAVLW
jgi:hypothetical protein